MKTLFCTIFIFFVLAVNADTALGDQLGPLSPSEEDKAPLSSAADVPALPQTPNQSASPAAGDNALHTMPPLFPDHSSDAANSSISGINSGENNNNAGMKAPGQEVPQMPLPPIPSDNASNESKPAPATADNTSRKTEEMSAPAKGKKGKHKHKHKHKKKGKKLAKEDEGPLPINYAIKDRLPSEIYKKSYDKLNGHLPVAYYESDYDRLLFVAAKHDDTNGLRSLIRAGHGVNVVDENGDTPLLIAVKHRAINAAHLLVLHNAETNITDGNGMTPMQIASENNDQDMVNILSSVAQ